MKDKILEAADKVLAEEYNSEKKRDYLGMSSLGKPCDRELWYNFRKAKKIQFTAEEIKRFLDGHHGENLQADRINATDEYMLVTVNPNTGKQFGFSHFNEHLKGHVDGFISIDGKNHVWEHKQVNEKKFNDLIKLVEKHGEYKALKEWDIIYYGQAILYMYFAGLENHYLTVSTPGGRDTVSCRTQSDNQYAKMLIDKAEMIIFSDKAPPRLSDNPSWFQCKMCDYHDICHKKAIPEINCRTCLHATVETDGGWTCSKLGGLYVVEDTMHCGGENHLYLPDMLGSKAIEATEESVLYEDGRTNFEGGRIE